MDNPLMTPEGQNEVIEEALRSYPVSAMPRGIAAHVMARIQFAPAPRFRLTSQDVLLAVVFTLVVSAVIIGIQFLPVHLLLRLRIQGILLWQDVLVNARWLVPAILFGLAALLAALTLPSLYQMTVERRG